MTVVWLHGGGMSGDVWRSQPGWSAIGGLTPDLPGHGTAPRTRPTVTAYADALEPALPERFALVGHSLGGMIAMELAVRHPARCRALVLAETAYRIGERKRDRLGGWAGFALAKGLGPRRLSAMLARSARGDGAAQYRRIESAPPGGLEDGLKAALTFDGTSLLPRIEAPTLVVIGSDNPRTHAQAVTMAQRIANASTRVLPGGHMLYADDPDAFFDAVGAFLADHP